MINIAVFCEDAGHSGFLAAIINRLSKELDAQCAVAIRNGSGGAGRALSELRVYAEALRRGAERMPDLLVVGIDSNCVGAATKRRQIEARIKELSSAMPDRISYAIPEPHVEHWLMVDSAAFRKVFGKGCAAPSEKCEKDRYKKLLLDAIRECGVNPPLGGVEYASEIVDEMNMKNVDGTLRTFLEDLSNQIRACTKKGTPISARAHNRRARPRKR